MSAGKTRAVVLLSGGMDSCVCAALAARDYDPWALHVMYGQRTEGRERRAFEGICERLGIGRRMVIRNEALRQIGGSALTDSEIAVPEARELLAAGGGARGTGHSGQVESSPGEGAGAHPNLIPGEHPNLTAGAHPNLIPGARPNLSAGGHPAGVHQTSEVPVTYVPFRNAHFLSAAVSWAEVAGAEKILIGAVEQDSSGYPDCRPAYYQAFNEVIRAGTREGNIEVVTPLIGLRKAEIVRLGLEIGAPFDLTWSCYSREDEACGVCESCLLRLRAFAAAGTRDPIPYAAGTPR